MVFYREGESERPALSLILPHLYLGAETDVTQDCLATQGISYVLSVSRCCPQPAFLPQKQYLRIPIDDSLRDELLPWIPEALAFIDGAMSRGCSVLVHCAAGVSRSPALAVAYVMYRLGLDLDDAYRFVKERRPSISPNFNFLGQLQSFQVTLAHKSCEVHQNDKFILPVGEDALSTNGNTGHNSPMPLPANQDVHLQNPTGCDIFSSSCAEVKRCTCCESSHRTVKRLNQDTTCSDHPVKGNNRQMPSVIPKPTLNQQCSPELTLSLADKLRTLAVKDSSEICTQDENAMKNGQPKPFPRPAELEISWGCMSLSEKRKSLKLSLTPLGVNPQTRQITKVEVELDTCTQRHQANISKTVQKREGDLVNNTTKPGKQPALTGLSKGEQSSPRERKIHQNEGSGNSPKVLKHVGGGGRGAIAALRVEEIDEVKLMPANSGLNPEGFRHTSTVKQQMSPESYYSAGVEAVEGLDMDQLPLSPLSMIVSKLLGWGERMLLGTLVGPRVKVGQPALPYPC